jgi:hypothetical protein
VPAHVVIGWGGDAASGSARSSVAGRSTLTVVPSPTSGTSDSTDWPTSSRAGYPNICTARSFAIAIDPSGATAIVESGAPSNRPWKGVPVTGRPAPRSARPLSAPQYHRDGEHPAPHLGYPSPIGSPFPP